MRTTLRSSGPVSSPPLHRVLITVHMRMNNNAPLSIASKVAAVLSLLWCKHAAHALHKPCTVYRVTSGMSI